MLNGIVCKMFGKKSVTLHDLIDLLFGIGLVFGMPMWTIGYYLIYGCPLSDDVVFISLCWLAGVVITGIVVICLISEIYKLTEKIKIAECPLNKK